jgi:hypothetical protein
MKLVFSQFCRTPKLADGILPDLCAIAAGGAA